MAQLGIIEHPDPRRSLIAQPVTDFDAPLGQLVDDMFETMQATHAIGLSAPQVGDRRAVLVLAPEDSSAPPQVYINPELVTKSALGFVKESCLSVPGLSGSVLRATRVRVRACNIDGSVFEQDLTGMDAVCRQHEMDHLAGKLFIDRISPLRRFGMRAAAALKGRQGQRAA